MADREDYGIDAPGVVRGLGFGGGALLIAGSIAALLIARGQDGALLETLRVNGLAAGGSMFAMSLWMIASSKLLKQRVLKRLLDQRQWRGDEAALDVGCGRGLVTVAIARRLARGGSVRGIDLWQAQDLSGNGPDAPLANARAAGVADRVTIETGDARQLPYADAGFDVIGSMTVIHNIPGTVGRDQALAEMLRVLKPGGQILLFDIRHACRYARTLRRLGAVEVTLSGPILLWGPVGRRLSARKP